MLSLVVKIWILESPLLEDLGEVCCISSLPPYSTLRVSHYLKLDISVPAFVSMGVICALVSHLGQSHPPNDWVG